MEIKKIMKRILKIAPLLFLITIGFLACEKFEFAKDTPHPIKKLIREEDKHCPCCWEEVIEWEYHNFIVYSFEPPSTNDFARLYDKKGNFLSDRTPGATGKGDGKYPDFEENAIKIRVIWTKKE
jgi:hypothetical protein